MLIQKMTSQLNCYANQWAKLVTLFVILMPPPIFAEPQARIVIPAVNQAIEKYVQQKSFAGEIWVVRNAEVVHARAYGYHTGNAEEPHQLDQEWRWASVTKMLAGLLVMEEVERGNLNLDTPISDWLMKLPAHMQNVTLRHLLNHTSGIANPYQSASDPQSGLLLWEMRDQPDKAYCYGPANYPVGEKFEYNGCDFMVIADILSAVTGMSFAQLVETRISQHFSLPSINIVTSPERDAEVKGTAAGIVLDQGLRLSALSAHAGAIGKSSDLAKLVIHYLDGAFIQLPELRAEFETGIPELGYVALSVWGYSVPLAGCNKPFRWVERQGYLMGSMVQILMLPEQKSALIMFSNQKETEWGYLWQGSGLSFEVASAAFCRS